MMLASSRAAQPYIMSSRHYAVQHILKEQSNIDLHVCGKDVFLYERNSFKENSLYKLDITRGKYKVKHTDHGNKVK